MDIRPTNDHIDWGGVILSIIQFVVKNILGILSVMFGIVAKVYIVRRQSKRISKWQCVFSVFMSGLAGTIAYCAVSGMGIAVWQKATITGFTPIVIEPVVLRTLIWIDPIIDSIGKALKKLINKDK